MDFEKSLIKVINNNFKKSKIDGCYFHFVKLLETWTKNMEFLKEKLKINNFLLFILKLCYLLYLMIEEIFSKNRRLF